MMYFLFLIIAAMLSGLIVFGGQMFANMGLSAFEVSTIPYVLGVLTLFPFVLINKNFRLKKTSVFLLLIYGLATALTIVGQFASLYFGIPVVIVVLLLYIQPLWTTLISYFFLKEKISFREILACIIVILGVVILINPFNASGNYNLVGLLVAAIGGLSLSGWIIIGSILSKRGNHPISSQFFGVTFTVILLVVLFPFLKYFNLPISLTAFSLHWSSTIWVWLILFAIFAVTINQLFYLWGVKKVKAVDAGIIMLLEPVVGAILAAIFLFQPLNLYILIGGVMILFANYLVIANNKDRE
ncbi:MAG: protein of unknown function transrane [Candidatus Berkelbacteria bacterium]|nr:protein of unknown function transrane [Candidatus Berkelbacteria bacterium]